MRLIPYFLLSFCLLIPTGASLAKEKTIFGLNERVSLPTLGIELAAKLDTGAQTASLSALDIEHFEREGEPWVRFTLGTVDNPGPAIERPLSRVSKIKRRSGDFSPERGKSYTPRPVVELDMCLGESLRRVEVNLTDRSAFKYPLLIGSDALADFGAIVDPSLTFASAEPACTDDNE